MIDLWASRGVCSKNEAAEILAVCRATKAECAQLLLGSGTHLEVKFFCLLLGAETSALLLPSLSRPLAASVHAARLSQGGARGGAFGGGADGLGREASSVGGASFLSAFQGLVERRVVL